MRDQRRRQADRHGDGRRRLGGNEYGHGRRRGRRRGKHRQRWRGSDRRRARGAGTGGSGIAGSGSGRGGTTGTAGTGTGGSGTAGTTRDRPGRGGTTGSAGRGGTTGTSGTTGTGGAPARARAAAAASRAPPRRPARAGRREDRANLRRGDLERQRRGLRWTTCSADGRANALRLFNLYRWLADMPSVVTEASRDGAGAGVRADDGRQQHAQPRARPPHGSATRPKARWGAARPATSPGGARMA